jgi:hypothetical protein
MQDQSVDRVYKLYSLTILLIPLNAILGCSLIWGIYVSVYAMCFVRKLSYMELLLVAILAVFVFSLTFHFAQFGFSQRIVAALYNICILSFATTALYYGRNIWNFDRTNIAFRRIVTSGFYLWVSSALFVGGTILYAAIYGAQDLTINTIILGHFQNLPGILKYYSTFSILGIDWLTDGVKPRPVGFGIYYTEGAAVFAFSGFLAKIYVQIKAPNLAFIVDALTLILINEMASRTLFMAYALGLAISLGMSSRFALRNSVSLVLMGAMALLFALSLGGMGFLETWLQESLSSRQGSTDQRFLSYTTAIDRVLNENIVFGLGVKPENPLLPEVPVGSHSTVISFFTKGGAAALSIFAIFYILLLVKWCLAIARFGMIIRNPNGIQWNIFKALFRAATTFMFWIWTDDVDAPFNGSILSFFLLGVGLGYIEWMYGSYALATSFCGFPAQEIRVRGIPLEGGQSSGRDGGS